MPSFDVVSEVDMQEVRNAVDQAEPRDRQPVRLQGHRQLDRAEGQARSSCETASEERLKALTQVLEEKFVKRKVSLKSLDYGKVEEASKGAVRQTVTLAVGINSDKAREIGKFIKGLGMKGVQHQVQGEQLRVTGKKRDDLQTVIAKLKEQDFGIPLQFENFRD